MGSGTPDRRLYVKERMHTGLRATVAGLPDAPAAIYQDCFPIQPTGNGSLKSLDIFSAIKSAFLHGVRSSVPHVRHVITSRLREICAHSRGMVGPTAAETKSVCTEVVRVCVLFYDLHIHPVHPVPVYVLGYAGRCVERTG